MLQQSGSVWVFISIHALREEGDMQDFASALQRKEFLSTPSARRATPRLAKTPLTRVISIHALREEGDALHPDTA